jgi:2-oxo-4-hydroxy-4-carboxy-5-ureidoimidazoline decarboxylase
MKLSIGQVNNMTEPEFVSVFGGIFESSPHIARAGRRRGPFADLAALHGVLCDVVRGSATESKLALIRAHPDLVGKAALAGTLSAESTREQASAGLDRLSEAEIAHFTDLNAQYRHKFNFPFVICARENRKEAILAGMKGRLGNSREEEINTAISEICKIAWLRLLDLVEDDR